MVDLRSSWCRLACLLTMPVAIGAIPVISPAMDVGGLYRNGQLVDTVGSDQPVPRAATKRSAASRSGSQPSGFGAPILSTETRQRNAVFAAAARRATKIRDLLVRMQQGPRNPGAAYRRLGRFMRLLKISQNQMRGQFTAIGERIAALGLDPSIGDKHLQTVAAFEQSVAEFDAIIEAVFRGEAGATQRALDLLEQRRFRTDPPLLSAGLPYDTDVQEAPRLSREAAQAALVERQPVATVPPPGPADLAETVDIQLTAAIQAKASALGNSPVAIYEFVRNNVAFQPYLGSRKGSDQTLQQLRGNDTDQASLLLALLRSAGIPSRYVRGTIELEPERAMSWLDVDDAATAASILTTAGLGGVAITNGSSIIAIQCTHVWVEAYVPYANYRGVPNDGTGKIWVPLDPSFKALSVRPGMDVLTAIGFNIDAFLADYISTFHTPSPIERVDALVQAYLDANFPGTTVGEVERVSDLVAQALGILPGSLPYRVITVSAQLSELEDTQRYKVRFLLYNGATNFIDYTINLPTLIGKRSTIQYLGATAADQATIDGFHGIYNTPPNLVNVIPVLKLDNVAVATSANSIGMGLSHSFDMQFIQPAGGSNPQPLVQNQIIAGNGEAIGFDTFLDVSDTLINDEPFPPSVFLESTLFTTALDYLNRIDRGQEEAQRLMHMVTTQDVSEAIVENAISVSFSFGTPITFQWTGLIVDADRRIVGPFAVNGDTSLARPYMILTGMDGSIMENRVFEDRFGQRAVSTIKILELSSDAAISLCTVTTNTTTDCPGMSQPASVVNAVNAAAGAGHVVTVPKSPITVGLWSGSGYVDMDPTTGAAGYIISGGISAGVQSTAGGATVDQWPLTLTCDALDVTAETLVPPADSPDPGAVFCADDTTITFQVRLTITCLDGPDQMQDVTLVTHKTKKQIGPGNYDLQLVFYGATTIRKITILNVDIQINNTPDHPDDVVRLKSDLPVVRPMVASQARIQGSPASDVAVVLTNPDGKLRFPAVGDTTKSLTLPKDGSFVPFNLAGEVASTAIDDAVIQAHLNSAGGPLCGQQKATVFSLDPSSIAIAAGGSYAIVGGSYTIAAGHAVDYSYQATLKPAGLDCTVPQIKNLRVGLMQNDLGGTIQVKDFNTPAIVWAAGTPAGTMVTVPSVMRQSTFVPVASNDSEASVAPLYDQPGKTGTLSADSLKPPMGCPGGAVATSFDTPATGAPATLTIPAKTAGGATVGTVVYNRLSVNVLGTFRDWAVCFDTTTSQELPLRETSWTLNALSTAAGAQKAVPAGSDAVPTHVPIEAPPFANQRANDPANMTQGGFGAATTTFTR